MKVKIGIEFCHKAEANSRFYDRNVSRKTWLLLTILLVFLLSFLLSLRGFLWTELWFCIDDFYNNLLTVYGFSF